MTQNWGQPPADPTPPATSTYKPDPKQYLNWIGRGFVAIGLLVVVFFISGRNIGSPATVIIMSVTAVLGLGFMMLRIATTSVTVHPDAFEYKNLFGSRLLPRNGLVGLVAPYQVLGDNRKARLLVARDPQLGRRGHSRTGSARVVVWSRTRRTGP